MQFYAYPLIGLFLAAIGFIFLLSQNFFAKKFTVREISIIRTSLGKASLALIYTLFFYCVAFGAVLLYKGVSWAGKTNPWLVYCLIIAILTVGLMGWVDAMLGKHLYRRKSF